MPLNRLRLRFYRAFFSAPRIAVWALWGSGLLLLSPQTALSQSRPESRRTPAFSFRFGGRESSEFLHSWRSTITESPLNAGRMQRKQVFTDPATGLQVTCVATEYASASAVEWLLIFENRGVTDTPILEDVNVADRTFPRLGSTEFRLRYSAGSHEQITDFQPFEVELPANGLRKFASFGGRSSDGVLPFFNLLTSDHAGVILAVGWTGQWSAGFQRDATTNVTFRAGMELTRLRLHPGEQIRTPAILAMDYEGNPDQGQNLFRRLLLRHFTPTVDGRPFKPLFAASPHAVVPFEKSSETNMIRMIDRIASRRIPIDYWWIDAGWFRCRDNWARWVGTWEPDPERFPRGLKPISDAAHAAGMKFLLWFEPERVMPDTWLHTQHPDWLLRPGSSLPAKLRYQDNDGFHLLNLGHAPAADWAKRHLSQFMADAGVDAYRNDFNLYPSYFWQHADLPDRQGITEIRYVTALYELFDHLHQQNPRLLLDNCASGGRRIDFEMLRRSVVLTRSDYLWDPIGQQCHNYGLAQWIPVTGIGAASLDAYSCQSGFGSHFVLAVNYDSEDSRVWGSISNTVQTWRAVAPFFTGDFHPLTAYSTNKQAWIAWQFHRHEQGDGVVQAFRRAEAPQENLLVRLADLDAQALYAVSNLETTVLTKMSGRVLMQQGLSVHLPTTNSAALLVYRRHNP